MTDETVQVWHCQICARVIKAKSGKIAHHGYTRDGHGYGQSASCYGARHVPYEVGHDALDQHIERVSEWRRLALNRFAEMTLFPPDTLTSYKGRMYKEDKELPRPEGFNQMAYSVRTSIPRTYENVFEDTIYRLNREITAMTQDIAAMKKRRAAWVAPSTPVLVQHEKDPLAGTMFSRNNFNAALRDAAKRYNDQQGDS